MSALETATNSNYIRNGCELLPGELRIDLSCPLVLVITGTNELTGEVRKYMLRVTSKGTICIV